MDKIQVKALDEIVEDKGVQQIEKELVDKHNKEVAEANEELKEENPETEGINDVDVLSYIKNRYDRDIQSIDELFDARQQNEELPEDVASFFKFKKETGRGMQDFMKAQQDVENISDTELISTYWSDTKPHLDSEDVKFEFNKKFGYNEDEDDESLVRERKIAKKAELAKAKTHFNDVQAKYKTPISESGEGGFSKEDYEEFTAYKEAQNQARTQQEEKSRYFTEKTNDVFNDEFEGFNFTINDNNFSYKPGEANKMRESQSDLQNFMKQHLTDEGYIADARKYHRALAAAMNPDAFARYFYEQGQSDQVTESAKRSKNINMGDDLRRSPQGKVSSGFKVASVPTSHGNGLRIRSKTKN